MKFNIDNFLETRDSLRRLLTIAYSSGYEHGHHDTVEDIFFGNGRPETHDYDSLQWLMEAETDGTFDRDLLI